MQATGKAYGGGQGAKWQAPNGKAPNGKTRASVNAFSSSSSRRCVPLRGAFTRSCRATCRWKTWCMRAYWG